MRSAVRFGVLTFVGMLLLQTAWILAVPPYHAIDEFDHAYRAAGGVTDEAALRRRTASSVLLRAVEPFRTALPDWRERLDDAVARAEEVLG